MKRLTNEHIKQIVNTLAAVTHVIHDLRSEGYEEEAVAEGMMEGAFFALANDRTLFLAMLDRFRQSYGL